MAGLTSRSSHRQFSGLRPQPDLSFRLNQPFKYFSESGDISPLLLFLQQEKQYGSVFGVKDSHDDVVMSGAFAASLREWSDRKALPALLWQHRMDEPIGVYNEMKEDDVGLYVKGRLLIDDDPLAKRAHAHMKAGSLTGLSIGYVLKDWEYDRSKEAFLLKEIDLWEVSLVTFPSNDEARISDVKNALARGEIPEQKKIERVLRDVGLSRTQAKAFMAGGYGALSLRDAEDVGSALNVLKNLNF